jgi:PAS domain S-box-containing protein
LWNAYELVTDSWLPPVAVNTASSFVLLGLGVLLSRPAIPSTKVARFAQVEIKVLSGFIFAMVLLVLGGNYAYRSNVRFADSVAWVTHTQEVRATVANVYGALAGAELALRDYLLYAQPDRWAEHQRLLRTVEERLQTLQELTVDNPAQQTNVSALKSLAEARIRDMASIMLANQQYGLPAARAVTRMLQLGHGTQAVEALVDKIESIETQLLAARQSAAEGVRRSTLISLLITLIIAFALFFVLFRGIHSEMRARREAEDALRASDQYNRSIIDSSPDCVSILDLDARLSQMTPHGLTLMGIDDFSTVANSDWLETWSGETRQDALRAVTSARDGAAGRFNGLYKTAAGPQSYWDVIVMPILGADGRATQLLAVARDITERKLAEEAIGHLNAELRDKATQLEATNKELESFTYSVSHDLRAPLRAIDGFALMIEEDCKERLDAEGQRYLTVIRDNSQKMGILIDDLLVFSRLGRQAVTRRDVNIDSLVREVVAEMVDAGSTTRFEVGSLPLVRGDRGLLRQVWVNLIANAVKYSGKMTRPEVQITGAQVGAETQYSVRDNGVGFDMAYAGKLFGVFQRLHRPDEFEGTGVGLAIVHRIVTRHGGRVWADGKVNEGAKFSFALPNGDHHG